MKCEVMNSQSKIKPTLGQASNLTWMEMEDLSLSLFIICTFEEYRYH